VSRLLGDGAPRARLARRVLAIGTSALAMTVLVLWVGRRLVQTAAPRADGSTEIASMGAPIAAEADVFRLTPADLAVPPDAERRPTAHPRTMAMYRSARAYPGAPPRIPHGLTREELLSGTCNSCHERGGYAPRFGLYAPVTPHPQYGQCLQCHVPDAELVGLPLPDGSRSSTCRQCHVLEGTAQTFVGTRWQTTVWPELDQRALPGSPPSIPHDLQMRGNCLACHAGPGAVAEIRTTHPERASCRSCHVPAPVEDRSAFTRPLDGGASP
jgi:nitrate reductase cytochrome c-type subunit